MVPTSSGLRSRVHACAYPAMHACKSCNLRFTCAGASFHTNKSFL
jgi:hypothetical protein